MSKHLGPAVSGPTHVAVANWDGVGIRPSFGVNKQLVIEEKDETMIQGEDTLAALVAQNKNQLTRGTERGTEAETRLGKPSYHQSQNEYLF